MIIIALAFLFLIPQSLCCAHDKMGHGYKLLQLNDTPLIHSRRLLQDTGIPTTGSLRIQLETSLFNTNTTKGKNLLNIVQIAKTFWENTLQLERLNNLIFPIHQGQNTTSVLCYDLNVPQRIVTSNYPNKDYGFIVQQLTLGPGGEVARSFPCAQLSSTRRPVWALISFNTDYFQYDPISFQNSIYVAIHEMTHCLGFSYVLYSSFVHGDPSIMLNGMQYLNSAAIQREIKLQFNCDSAPGMLIESQGAAGTAGSHWSRKAFGNQFMTASVVFSNPTISYITLALLQTTGWYTKVNRHFGSFVNYGHNSGCKMLDPKDCSSREFCKVLEQQSCDVDYIAGGHCTTDSYSNVCSYYQYYSNYICTDPTYTNKKINNIGNTGEAAGYNSRCFVSDVRGVGEAVPKHGMRCYPISCSKDLSTITLQVGNSKSICKNPNEIIRISGFDGTIRCPKDFKTFCASKSCPNNCYSNGVCVKGNCICNPNYSGSYCMYPNSGGATLSLNENAQIIEKDMICMVGTYLDQLSDCIPCDLGCGKCNAAGCIVCLNGNLPVNGNCN